MMLAQIPIPSSESIVGALIAFGGAWGAMSLKLAKVETKLTSVDSKCDAIVRGDTGMLGQMLADLRNIKEREEARWGSNKEKIADIDAKINAMRERLESMGVRCSTMHAGQESATTAEIARAVERAERIRQREED